MEGHGEQRQGFLAAILESAWLGRKDGIAMVWKHGVTISFCQKQGEEVWIYDVWEF